MQGTERGAGRMVHARLQQQSVVHCGLADLIEGNSDLRLLFKIPEQAAGHGA